MSVFRWRSRRCPEDCYFKVLICYFQQLFGVIILKKFCFFDNAELYGLQINQIATLFICLTKLNFSNIYSAPITKEIPKAITKLGTKAINQMLNNNCKPE